jgi:ethanolamine utilization cobalamin adenosyltransferase
MKKLITERIVRQAWQDGIKEIAALRAETIVTPEARGLAKDLGIKLVEDEAAAPCCAETASGVAEVDEAAVRAIVERVVERLPQFGQQPEMIRDVVIEVIRRYVK